MFFIALVGQLLPQLLFCLAPNAHKPANALLRKLKAFSASRTHKQ
jgi:hypothetical protein